MLIWPRFSVVPCLIAVYFSPFKIHSANSMQRDRSCNCCFVVARRTMGCVEREAKHLASPRSIRVTYSSVYCFSFGRMHLSLDTFAKNQISWPLHHCETKYTLTKKNEAHRAPCCLPLGCWPTHGLKPSVSIKGKLDGIFCFLNIVKNSGNKFAFWNHRPHTYPKKKGKSRILSRVKQVDCGWHLRVLANENTIENISNLFNRSRNTQDPRQGLT